MRSNRTVVLRMLAVVMLATIGLIGMTSSASAQTACTEAPFLSVADSNGDGIASTGELRAIAPGNAELEQAVSMLEGAGLSGIQYQGCGGNDVLNGGGQTGGGDGSGSDGGVTGDGSTGGQTGGDGTGDTGTGDTGTTGAGTEGSATGGEGATGQAGDGTVEITEQEQAYLDAVLADMGEFLEVVTAIEALFTEVGEDPTLLEDETWNADVDEQLELWRQIVVDAETLEPSERQQQIHDIWLSITTLLGLAVEEIDTGLETQDEAVMTTATDRLTYVTLLLEDLNGSIAAFQTDPSAPYELEYALNPVPDCTPFRDYEIAQQYYAAWPEEQPTIDPDSDGLACEVFFGVESE